MNLIKNVEVRDSIFEINDTVLQKFKMSFIKLNDNVFMPYTFKTEKYFSKSYNKIKVKNFLKEEKKEDKIKKNIDIAKIYNNEEILKDSKLKKEGRAEMIEMLFDSKRKKKSKKNPKNSFIYLKGTKVVYDYEVK